MNDQHQTSLHGGNVWAASQRWNLPIDSIIDFSANINPIGPSIKAMRAIEESLSSLQHYPEPQGQSCVLALSRYLQVPKEQLILGNGGAELIYLVGRMFYKQQIMRLSPTFSEYGEGIESPNITEIPLTAQTQFALPVSVMIDRMQENGLIFIGNPNNPTGTLFTKDEIRQVVKAAKAKSAIVIVDEAFIDFTGNHHVYSMRYMVAEYPNLIIVGSLTKFFAIPALRLGYGIASEETIARMMKLLPPWRINTLAIRAGVASLSDEEYIEKTVKGIDKERESFRNALQQINGLYVHPSVANFVLVDGKGTGQTAIQLQEKLGPKGFLIRVCDSFRNLSAYHFRLAIRNQHENNALIEILKEMSA